MMNETGSAGEANARPWHLGRAPDADGKLTFHKADGE